jgi:hypothetical protein
MMKTTRKIRCFLPISVLSRERLTCQGKGTMITAILCERGVAAPSVRTLGEKNGHSGSECVREHRGPEGRYPYVCPMEAVEAGWATATC